MQQGFAVDCLLNTRVHEIADIVDIVIWLQINPCENLKLQENVGVHPRCCKNLHQALGVFHGIFKRIQQLDPSRAVYFIHSIDTHCRLRKYVRELDKYIHTFLECEGRRLLSFIASVFVNLDNRFEEFVSIQLGLDQLPKKGAQNGLGSAATLLGSIAVEVHELVRLLTGQVRIDNFRSYVGFSGSG